MIENSKEKYKVFIQNMLLYSIVFSVYLFNDHYSNDTFSVLHEGITDINLINARYVNYIIGVLLDTFHIQIFKNLYIVQWITICGISFISWKIYCLFSEIRSFSLVERYIIRFFSIIIFANLSYFEHFSFVEVCALNMIGELFCFYAIKFNCMAYESTKKCKNLLLAFSFLFLALNVYQAHVEIFVILCTLYLIVKTNGQFTFRDFFSELNMIMLAAIASLLNILLSSVVKSTGTRHATLSLEIILDNIKQLLNLQKSIWTNFYGWMPNYIMPLTLIVIVYLCCFIFMKKKKKIDSFFIMVMLMGMYLIVFMPLLISTSFWCPPRTIRGIFIFISAIFVLTVILEEKNIHKFALIFLLILFGTMSIQINRISVNNVISNRIDEEIALEIRDSIAEYEAKTDNTITTFIIGHDSEIRWNYNTVKYSRYDSNIRGYAIEWNDVKLINYYTGKNYLRKGMTEDEYYKYFKSENYENLNLEKQLKFDGDCAFLLIY